MHDRIKQVRKSLQLNQTEFGKPLGISQTTIAGYENGARKPLNSVVNLICSQYNVNKDWLLTGEGEMFIQLSRDEQIAEFVGKALAGSPDNIKRSLLAALSVLPESGWDALEEFVDKLIEQRTKKETTDE